MLREKELHETLEIIRTQDLHHRLACAFTDEPYFPPDVRKARDAFGLAVANGKPVPDSLPMLKAAFPAGPAVKRPDPPRAVRPVTQADYDAVARACGQ
jgi:hypothetical protein